MMNEQTQQALRAVYTHASWIDAEMDESTLAEVRAAMMQCKTPTAYDKVYKVREARRPRRIGVVSKRADRSEISASSDVRARR